MFGKPINHVGNIENMIHGNHIKSEEMIGFEYTHIHSMGHVVQERSNHLMEHKNNRYPFHCFEMIKENSLENRNYVISSYMDKDFSFHNF